MTTRLSIPGNYCKFCGTKIGEEITCGGCGHVDPVTINQPEEGSGFE